MAQDRLARVIPSMHVHLCVALWLFSLHPSPSSTLFRCSPSGPSRCLPQSSTRGSSPTPCATSAWGPWPLLTTRHPSQRENRKEREKKAAASSGSTVPQEDRKAEAAKDEGPSTETVGNKDVGSRREASPRDRTEEMHKRKTTFIVLQKNTRSLNSSERLEVMCSELHRINWDAILISETWRQNKEIWETQQGHIMVESGKFTNKHGVAILLNRRLHNRINFIQCACERVVAMSISVNKHPVVLMSVYLPHSGYADHHVERTYKTIIFGSRLKF